jgi:hypothetical protein
MIRYSIFFAAAGILGLGFLGSTQLEKEPAMAFLLGALTLGGGLFICGLFSIKMLWHGITGAGVLALLGFGRGILNLPDLARLFNGIRDRGNAPMLEFAVTLICGFLLLRIYQAWLTERTRRLREP